MTQFWNVPYKQNYCRDYDNENNKFCPAWDGHDVTLRRDFNRKANLESNWVTGRLPGTT
jgi:hypothetical protein